MKKNFKYVLFDWDGCIVDTLPVWFHALRQVLSKHGITPTEEIVLKSVAEMDWLTEIGVTDIHVFRNDVYQIVNENIENVCFCNEAENTLKTIQSQGKKTALVSSSRRVTLETIMTNLKSDHSFDAIITQEDVAFKKPHPEPVLKALQILGAHPEETLIIGDSSVDILAGKAAGITTVLYHSEDNQKIYSQMDLPALKPDFIIENLHELINIVQ